MLEWLERQLELNNFGAIFDKIVRDNSLQGICGTVADAVYKEFDDPDSDRTFCLRIIQAMLDKGWHWSNIRDDIHRLLPLIGK